VNPTAPPTGPTVADIVAAVGPPVLTVAHGGDALAAPVGDVSIVDHLDPETLVPGAVLLAVAVDPEGGHAVALVDRAIRAGAAAVVLKSDRPLPPRVLEPAVAGRMAVLAVPPEMAWGQLYALLRTALSGPAAGRREEAGAVPVGDLFALADAVAAAVGAPVTIEDSQWRVLAYSNLDQPVDEARRETILGREPPAEWQRRIEEAGVLQELRSGSELVRFRHEGLDARVIAAVRAGDELLGSIWALEGAAPLSAAAEEELRRAAQRAAIHVLAHRSAEDLERRRRAAVVRDVLEGRAPAGEAFAAAGQELVAVAFALAPGAGEAPVNLQRLAGMVGLFAGTASRSAEVAVIGQRIWALAPVAAGSGPQRLVEMAERVVARAESVLSLPLHAGIGPAVAAVGDVPQSRDAARRALAVLERRSPAAPAVAHAEDVREHATLLELLDFLAGRPDAERSKVGRLAALDAERDTTYLTTLRAWLDAHGDTARAAKALDVHVNTLRYRLRRLAEIAGLDLDDPDERLVVALQLRVLERG
jgi:DNA-binding PucR family transcriptional regulator